MTLLAIVACVGMSWAANPSGSCGDNLTWEFDSESGALTIGGTGAMASAPWAGGYNPQVISVTLPDGLTSISQAAFNDCSSLTSVTIPNSVTSIGICAFLGCSSLT